MTKATVVRTPTGLTLMTPEEARRVDGGCGLPGRPCDLLHRTVRLIIDAIKLARGIAS